MPLVKPDNHLISDEDDWYAHLTTAVDHLFALLKIRGHVVIRERNVVRREEFLRCMTEVTCRRRVNGNRLLGGHTHYFYY